MIRLFRSPQPTVLLLIPLITTVIWGFHWDTISVCPPEPISPLWNLVYPLIAAFPQWLDGVLMIILVTGTSIYFNLILNRHEVLYRSTYLPSLFYVLFVSATPVFLRVHPLHFTNLLLLLVLDHGFSLIRGEQSVGRIFSSGLLVSMVVLLFLPLLPLVIFYFMLVFMLRSSGFREWLICLTGLLLPFFFLAVWWFPDQLLLSYQALSRQISELKVEPASMLPLKEFWLVASAGFLVLLGLLKIRSNYYKNIVRTRILQQAILLLLLFTSLMALFSGLRIEVALLVTVLPVTAIVAYYFSMSRQKSWFVQLLFWAWLGLIIWNHLGTY